ncbi:MAG: tetratricopeptide repeat protein [bacterium]|nr:tetratricopeptide repeat protein [bacterium]
MKKIWLVGLSCILILTLFMACTPKENLELKKEQAVAARNLGEAYLRQGNYSAALRELLKAEKMVPDDYFLHNDLGLAYYYKGVSEKAIYHYKKSLAIKDDYAPARNNLGNAYAAQKDWDNAIEQYKIVTSDLVYATPQFPYSNLGIAYYHKKEFGLSEKYFKQALATAPEFDRALWGLSNTYIATGRIAEAVETLEFAVKKHPGNVSLHFELAEAYLLKRDYRRAYGSYIQVVQIDPDSPLADRALLKAKRIKPLL